MPLRIVHLGKYYPPAYGGIETHVRTLATAQAELGAEVQVLCVDHANSRNGQSSKQARAARSVEWDGPVQVTRLRRRSSFARFDFCPGIRQSLDEALEQQVDVVHLHVPNPTMLLALPANRLSIPLVITYHSDIVRQKILARLLRPFEHYVFERASRVLATSPRYVSGSRLLQRYSDNVDVLPFGITLQPFLSPSTAARDYASRLLHEHGEPLWLSVGRLVYYKGLEVALHALRKIPGKLLVVGEGPLHSRLRTKAAALQVADRVVWLGRLSDDELAGAYQAATAFWFPSIARSEAFGLVQVEAMASGCPVINTEISHSGVAWVSRHGESGLTVPVNDPQALARAAMQLVEQPELRLRLSAGGIERAKNDFGHAKMAQRSLDLYHEVCRDPQPSAGAELAPSNSLP